MSDVYVRLGYEFNLACRAFNSIGVDTSDLGNVPDLLRHILEDTLSQPASPQALDNYLPRIRDIIITLLHGLKRKQSKLRGRGSKESTDSSGSKGPPARNASLASSVASNESGITQMLDNVPATTSPTRGGSPAASAHSREDSNKTTEEDVPLPSAGASGSLSRGSINRQSMRRDQAIPHSDTDSAMSSTTAQNTPVQPPFEANVRPPSEVNFPHPPPPPPKQTDALAQLQRGGDLERRASRRFSAYQISKHLGASPNGIPNLPPTQNSPIPNRGREARESMTAVRSRTSQYRRPHQKPDPSPSRSGTVKAPEKIPEESDETPKNALSDLPKLQHPGESTADDSPITKTPDEYKPKSPQEKRDAPMFSATLNGPMSPPDSMLDASFPTPKEEKNQDQLELQKTSTPEESGDTAVADQKARELATPPPVQSVDVESTPPPGKELTLFLQYKTKIKKFVLHDGYQELTFARLQLAFIEKFSWNTNETGLELPEIYIQDPVSGVRHELEELNDVKDRSVLVLNVEALDEVKKHFDEGMGGIQKTLDGFRSLLEGQGSMMQRFSDRQLEASKEMARMSAVPPAHTPKVTALAGSAKSAPAPASGATLQELQTLRREIAVLRQTYSSMSSDFTGAMSEIRAKAANVKAVAADAAVPNYGGDAGRAHINSGKKHLSTETESLINRVDDLADIVEELRKDVVTRGVRPLPRQLEDISKDIATTMKDLVKIKEYVKREKPVWTKIWEQELKMVMSERDDLTQRDEIIADLDGDLNDVTDIFKLVEEAMKQQNLQAQGPQGGRSSSKNLAFESDMDPHEAKSGMLDEVRALNPNHENRLEAIERAEKARQKELQSRKGGEFQREVESFVEEGKLKKTGGVDEIERVRRIKDQQAQKENWETQEKQKAEQEARRLKRMMEKQARAKAAQEQEQAGGGQPDGTEGDNTGQEAPSEDAKEDGAAGGNDAPAGTDGPPTLPEIETGEGDDKAKSGTSFLED